MGGPKTTTTQQQQTQQQQQQAQTGMTAGTSLTTPTMPGWYQQFLQQIPGQYGALQQQLGGMAQRPLYGPQQQAAYQQQLGQQLGQAGQDITSRLASQGALTSSRAAEAQTGLALGGAQQMGQYLSQVPLLNAQYQQNVLGQLGNVLANAAGFKIPIGQQMDTTSLQNMLSNLTGQTQESSQSVSQQTGGLMQSLLGGLLGAGMSALTGGIGGALGGGGFGAGAAGGLGYNPVSAAPQAAPSGMPNYGPGFTVMPWQLGGAGAPPQVAPSYGGGWGGFGLGPMQGPNF